MAELRIYGASDDLIEVEGDAREEYPAASGHAVVLLSTGDVIRFRFETEGWRATIVENVTGPTVALNDHDDDVVTVKAPRIAWLMVGPDEPLRIGVPRRG